MRKIALILIGFVFLIVACTPTTQETVADSVESAVVSGDANNSAQPVVIDRPDDGSEAAVESQESNNSNVGSEDNMIHEEEIEAQEAIVPLEDEAVLHGSDEQDTPVAAEEPVEVVELEAVALPAPTNTEAENAGNDTTQASPPTSPNSAPAEVPDNSSNDNGTYDDQTQTTPPTQAEPPAQEEPRQAPAETVTRNGFITFRRTGGFAGFDDTWEIYPNGRILDDKGGEFWVDAGTIQRIWFSVDSGQFFTFAPIYKHKQTVNDYFNFDITVNDGSRAHSVHVIDQAPGMPASLQAMIQEIMQNVQNPTY